MQGVDSNNRRVLTRKYVSDKFLRLPNLIFGSTCGPTVCNILFIVSFPPTDIIVYMFGYLAFAFALAGCSSFFLAALARKFAPRLGFLDQPDGERKLHRQPTPLMGGLAVFLAILGTCGIVLLLEYSQWIELQTDIHFVVVLLVSAASFCGIGLYDDKYSLRASYKLVFQLIACLPFAICGHSIQRVEFLGAAMDFGFWGIPFTTLWLIACVNVVNLIDGMDGLASTICLIVAIVMAPIAMINGNIGIATLSLIFAGSLAGFLVHNWPPAKIFLGDAGSLLIGFMAGALSIGGAFKTATGFTLIMPLVVLSVPFFDTFLAIVRRKLKGQQISRPDRCHIHHQLQDRGLSSSQTLLLLTGICVLMGMAAVISALLQTDVFALLGCISVLAFLVAGRVFAQQETNLLFRHLRAVRSLLANLRIVFKTELLAARLSGHTTGDWLEIKNEIQSHVTDAYGVDLELSFRDQRNGQLISSVKWQGNHPANPDSTTWHFSRSQIRDRDYCVTLSATGRLSAQPASKQLAELIRLMDVISQHWPVDQQTADVVLPWHTEPTSQSNLTIDPIKPRDGSTTEWLSHQLRKAA